MSLHHVRTDAVARFDYGFGGNIGGRMADIGRSVGSQSIGLMIQEIAPGNRASRRHRHVFLTPHVFLMPHMFLTPNVSLKQ